MAAIISVGLAAYGMSGKVFHGPLLQSHRGFCVRKILERTGEKSRQDFPEAQRVRTWEEVLADPEIDLVIVNTPPHYHFSMCAQALRAGKHVVGEKPFTVTTSTLR